MSTVRPTETRSRGWVRPLLALAAIVGGLGLASAFVALVVLVAGVGWYVANAGADVVARAPVEASLDRVVVEPADEDLAYTEPVRREVPVRRSGRNRSTSPAPAAPDAMPAVAEATSDEPADAGRAEPTSEEAIRALRARIANGELRVVEGEAGRVSVHDG